jgi:hypothetical protein
MIETSCVSVCFISKYVQRVSIKFYSIHLHFSSENDFGLTHIHSPAVYPPDGATSSPTHTGQKAGKMLDIKKHLIMNLGLRSISKIERRHLIHLRTVVLLSLARLINMCCVQSL